MTGTLIGIIYIVYEIVMPYLIKNTNVLYKDLNGVEKETAIFLFKGIISPVITNMILVFLAPEIALSSVVPIMVMIAEGGNISNNEMIMIIALALISFVLIPIIIIIKIVKIIKTLLQLKGERLDNVKALLMKTNK